jgi:hypothetical protein
VTEIVIAVLTVVLVVYATSATAKIRSGPAYRSYRDGLGETALVPRSWLPLTAAALAGCEVAVAMAALAAGALTLGSWPAARIVAFAALGLAALLTSVLAVGIGVVLHRGIRAPCACFGSGSVRPLGGAHLARNVAMLALLMAGLAGNVAHHGQPAPPAAVVTLAAAAVAALLLIHLDDLAELLAPMPMAATVNRARR